MNVVERPGVFAQILKVLGDLDISIASAIQKETDDDARRAEIVLMTHRAKEASVQSALKAIDKLQVVNRNRQPHPRRRVGLAEIDEIVRFEPFRNPLE